MAYEITLIEENKEKNYSYHVQDNMYGGRMYKLNVKFRGDLTILTYPTANCQVCSIGNAQMWVDYPDFNMIYNVIKDHLQPQMLIDIKSNYCSNVENLFLKDEIVFKNQYSSTNGSNMTMYLINVMKLRERKMLEARERLNKINERTKSESAFPVNW